MPAACVSGAACSRPTPAYGLVLLRGSAAAGAPAAAAARVRSALAVPVPGYRLASLPPARPPALPRIPVVADPLHPVRFRSRMNHVLLGFAGNREAAGQRQR